MSSQMSVQTTPYRRNFGRRFGGNKYGRRRRMDKKFIDREINRLILSNQEKKYFDSQINGNISDTGQTFALSSVTQGDTDTQRDGDKLKYLMIKWNGQFILQTLGFSSSMIRMILFQYHDDSTGGAPAPVAVLQTASYNQFYNHDLGSQFSVLYDRSYAMSENGNINAVISGKLKLKKTKFGKMKYFRNILKFNGGAATGLDQIYALLITDGAISVNANIRFRLLFTDS